VEKKEISGYGEGNYFLGSGNTDHRAPEALPKTVSVSVSPFSSIL
jgi:hypothetical protein